MTINVLDFLEQSAARFADKIAVIEGDLRVTYAQLLSRSRAVGSALADKVGVGKPTGVYMEKGVHALISMFGIVYAGGCYSLLSPELPDVRLRHIQSVLRTETIVTTAQLEAEARDLFPQAEICTVETLSAHPLREDALQCIRERMLDIDPLYINFTSGSTGVPKGIAVSHRSVIDFISYFTELFSITENDRIANQAPFDFDVSVKDIYSAVRSGATLVIVPRQLFSAPTKLLDYLCEHRITTMIWAVSALCLVTTFHGLDYRTPDTVNKILFSGEVMPQKALRDWKRHLPDAMFVNLYGPTEITCNCTYHILEPDRSYEDGIPIGKPFPNEDVMLLDDQNRPVASPGTIGRILVRGTALALGYYGMPEKTAACFVQNPLNYAYPELVYETGDLGCRNDRGELMYCGRKDNQIKIMGHRVELEEIEYAMEKIDGVERCICLFDEKRSRLKGYYVGTIEKDRLFTLLHQSLPPFMIPGILQKTDSIPLTKNGKADRKKLAELLEGKNK